MENSAKGRVGQKITRKVERIEGREKLRKGIRDDGSWEVRGKMNILERRALCKESKDFIKLTRSKMIAR